MSLISRVIDKIRTKRVRKDEYYWSAIERIAAASTDERAALQSLEADSDAFDGVDIGTVQRDIQLMLDFNAVRGAGEQLEQRLRELKAAQQETKRVEAECAQLEAKALQLRRDNEKKLERVKIQHEVAARNAIDFQGLRDKLAQAGHPAYAAAAGGVA